ncbi:HupE/UreJ family protein [Rubrimonas cliftonensis]|uniref:HupE / UreJ protein n=1 Tax=Rubrimonas cliftonensis TaxID=89524 RepID=A0A1H3WRM5_9RHOB|nr:HupE/UreJ family protein [Rubrimonas cliftonensis]SDZ89032.1 HupE / UreJ protein [Rubrimonas cliftonensis]
MSGLRPPFGAIARRLRAVVLGAAALIGVAASAEAHEASMSVVSVTEMQPGRYAARWDNRPSETGDADGVKVEPLWPEHCVADGPMLECGAEGLAGDVSFTGLGVAHSAAMIRIRALDGGVQVLMLTPSDPVAVARPNFDATSWSGRAELAGAYVNLGVEHILIGIDHLLFVLGLMWISGSGWGLVRTITAFTVAHSFTLAAVSFGWIGVPEAFVNAMIALSIVFIGVEILKADRGDTSFTLRNPWLAAFGFGLLHGFGFANALMELGLPEGAALLALLAFNVGVEIGQLVFVLLALGLAAGWRYMTAPMPRRSAPPAAYVVGSVAAFWFVERAAALLIA